MNPSLTAASREPAEGTRSYARSRALQARAQAIIPGGCHTYAKGDDQYPEESPGFIERGRGCHVWDPDGNEFIEYGMGCRAVTLGHGFGPVVEAARAAMSHGTNFTRPAPIEVECAEELLSVVPGAEMVKFTKDGSSATTAALRLARAHTGRDRIALCADHPFFAIHDWFIGTTPMNAGIPGAIRDLSLTFPYGDLEALHDLFGRHPGEIAAVIMEPSRGPDPPPGYLPGVRDLCSQEGAVFILDEMITGFRWDVGGAQRTYGVVPDLSTFGKALGNGFSVSALAGKRSLMERGGLGHDRDRVFLLSTTHGAETHALAAAIETIRTYKREPVVEHLHRQGERLRAGLDEALRTRGLEPFVQIEGRACNLWFVARDRALERSQAFRTLLLQEAIRRGVIMPSLVVSYAHRDEDIERTIDALGAAFDVYARALEEGVERHLVGRPSQVVHRRRN